MIRDRRILATGVGLTLILGLGLVVAGSVTSPSATPQPTPPSGDNILGIDLASLPRSGPAYERVLDLSQQSATLDLQADTGPGNDVLLAKAIMGDRAGVLSMLRAAENRDSASLVPIGPARNLIAWALAANLAGVHEEDAWFRAARDRTYRFGQLAYPDLGGRANNHGVAAETALIAIDAHLGDWAHFEDEVMPSWLARLTGAQVGFRFGGLGHQADPSQPVVVGRPGATKQGVNLDGTLPEELRRHGSFPNLRCGDYVLATAGHFLLSAQVLDTAGYDGYGWGSNATERIFAALERMSCNPSGDDRWLGQMALGLLGEQYLPLGGGDGKYMCCTDWLYGAEDR